MRFKVGGHGLTLRRVSVEKTDQGKVARFEGDRVVLTWLTPVDGPPEFEVVAQTDRGEVKLEGSGLARNVLDDLLGHFGTCVECGAWGLVEMTQDKEQNRVYRCDKCAPTHNERQREYIRAEGAVDELTLVLWLVERIRSAPSDAKGAEQFMSAVDRGYVKVDDLYWMGGEDDPRAR